MNIRLLAPDVAAKIAAGEVVERPANVAKELIENSLDAGATEIRVEVREGGQRQLRITDNGHGILADEIELAFERHATSKLDQAEDLYQIATFGFRGEALYSISAVGQVTLSSRHETEPFGTQIRVEGGQFQPKSRTGMPTGTVITVENLFFNVPARKKFLRRPATEAGHISSVIQRYALAYPERRFSFVNEGRLVFQSSGNGKLFDVLTKVYKLENAKQMVAVGKVEAKIEAEVEIQEVEARSDLNQDVDFMGEQSTEKAALHNSQFTVQNSQINIAGYTSLPSLTRANRSNIDLFINNRYVEDRSLNHAVVQAYHTLLPVGRYPVSVIFVDIDPSQVDVNVHPQKTQVRFYEERKVFSAVQKAVRRTVMNHATIPDVSLSEDGSISHTTAFQHPGMPGQPSMGSGENRTLDSGWSERRSTILNAGQGQRNMDMFTPDSAEPTAIPMPPHRPEPPIEMPMDGDDFVPDLADMPPASHPISQPDTLPSEGLPEQSPDLSTDQPAPEQQVTDPPGPNQSTEQSSLLKQRSSQLPPLRVVGQVGAMYIIAEGPQGLYLIDQHAAHERILYEKFMAQRHQSATDQIQSSVARQHLLEPLTLHIGDELTGLVAQHLDKLNYVGFEIEPFGGNTFLVRAVPSVLSGQEPLQTLEEIVQAMSMERNLVAEELEARLVKMVCKRAAIKAGQLLSDIEMQELIHQLEDCQSPRTCPHGRPTMIQLSANELEKAFGRI